MAETLAAVVQRYTERQGGRNPLGTEVAGLTILRSDYENMPVHRIFKPSLCVVVQGAKWAMIGDRHLYYGAGQALVITVEVPTIGCVVEASPSEPYLGIIIEFDLAVMRSVLEELTTPPQPSAFPAAGVAVGNFDGPLADCVLRMVRLLDTPDAIPMLSPAIRREIGYWLLTGPHGGEIARLALSNSHDRDILSAIHTLRDRFKEPIRVEELARIANLSASAFHRQFKAVTAMTPLQYQKRLRLLEARRLMMTEGTNSEAAAHNVGYESASQFSREYARMFGAPPRRDVVGLRQELTAGEEALLGRKRLRQPHQKAI